jgi:hypothetical protein
MKNLNLKNKTTTNYENTHFHTKNTQTLNSWQGMVQAKQMMKIIGETIDTFDRSLEMIRKILRSCIQAK